MPEEKDEKDNGGEDVCVHECFIEAAPEGMDAEEGDEEEKRDDGGAGVLKKALARGF